MSVEDSTEFINGCNDEEAAHYHVNLTESMLDDFEVLNSMCLLNDFDRLLFFLECQMESCKLVIPPFDIFIVLMTLITVSDHYKDGSLRSNDPYNVSRISLNRRSLKILQFYVKKLKEFDVGKYGCYRLELLRCQLFIAYDSISPGSDKFHQKRRLRRTNSGLHFDLDSSGIEFKEPYKSYISCLNQKQNILGNKLINLTLNRRSEFRNMILWTLSNSTKSDQILYLDSHDVWMPFLNLLLDILELRQDYFLRNESNRDNNTKYVQRLGASPFALFLSVFESVKFTDSFSECIFINCDYEKDENLTPLDIHPVYDGETMISNTFYPRIRYTNSYKIKKSFSLRRRILGICFGLLTVVPRGHRPVSPRTTTQDISDRIATILVALRDLEQFKAFFSSHIDNGTYFLSYIVEVTFLEILKKFGKKPLKESKPGEIVGLDDVDTLFEHCKYYIISGLFAPRNSKYPEDSYLDVRKADTCLLVLMRCYGRNPDTTKKREFLHALIENDKKRNTRLPLLYPLIGKLIECQ